MRSLTGEKTWTLTWFVWPPIVVISVVPVALGLWPHALPFGVLAVCMALILARVRRVRYGSDGIAIGKKAIPWSEVESLTIWKGRTPLASVKSSRASALTFLSLWSYSLDIEGFEGEWRRIEPGLVWDKRFLRDRLTPRDPGMITPRRS